MVTGDTGKEVVVHAKRVWIGREEVGRVVNGAGSRIGGFIGGDGDEKA